MTYRPHPSSRIVMLDAWRGLTWYVRLFSAPVAEDGTGGTEISGGNYSGGVAVTFGSPSGGIIANTNSLQWTASATATLGNIPHGLIADTATGAWTKGWNIEWNPNLLWQSGLPVNVAIGDLTINLND